MCSLIVLDPEGLPPFLAMGTVFLAFLCPQWHFVISEFIVYFIIAKPSFILNTEMYCVKICNLIGNLIYNLIGIGRRGRISVSGPDLLDV